ncbi:hypothetical protein ACFO5R_03815 [Halosolutus amylolyticus]|uniref:DUF8001 domain-containing protein n=1 Tax=Halosolutus amylolyticus TaxID=2932267 RepID=A0ABD5PL40_9EURY|nr:hypothetical protein [Halosolutus amylolyticus]
MADPLRITAGELDEDAILDALQNGRRIVVTTTTLGTDHEVTLRYDGSVYYCDTPTRLHRHETEREMRTCVRNMGYASDSAADSE